MTIEITDREMKDFRTFLGLIIERACDGGLEEEAIASVTYDIVDKIFGKYDAFNGDSWQQMYRIAVMIKRGEERVPRFKNYNTITPELIAEAEEFKTYYGITGDYAVEKGE